MTPGSLPLFQVSTWLSFIWTIVARVWHQTFKIVNNDRTPPPRSKEIGENQIVSCQTKPIWVKQQQTPWGADGGIGYPLKFGLGRIIAGFHRWNVHPKTSNVLESTFGKVSRASRLTLLTASHWELPLGIFNLVVPFVLNLWISNTRLRASPLSKVTAWAENDQNHDNSRTVGQIFVLCATLGVAGGTRYPNIGSIAAGLEKFTRKFRE
jgi:hypothetical protein